ncbi:MAG: glycosyltransferase family 1 protein [Dysgonamonadaceae bacterium]|jgi:hypothetical protein|nr:glycosyltransferase family 1 protein [Dysgonamonadaceae bacterium]
MKFKGILSYRKHSSWPSFDLVYEWEDYLSQALHIPIKHKSADNYRLISILIKYKLLPLYRTTKKWLLKYQGYYLYFILGVSDGAAPIISRRKIIPVIVDFFVSPPYFSQFYENYKEYDLVLISDYDAYNQLKKAKTPLNIAHFPLSLSDVYRLTPATRFEKKYKLLVAGRENPLLVNYLNLYLSKYPDFEYVYRKMEDGKFFYVSNKTGLIGEFGTRNEFIQLIRASKCAVYSTPGIDGDEVRTKGFAPLTPRFLEFVAAKCFILARYLDNDDARYFDLKAITPSIESYEAFENTLNEYLKQPDTPSEYVSYLQKHYTSERATLLKNILNNQSR